MANVPTGTPPEIWLVVVVVSAAFGFAVHVLKVFVEAKRRAKNGGLSDPPPRPAGVPAELVRLIEDLHHDRDGIPRWTVTKKMETTLLAIAEEQRRTNTQLQTLIELERQQNVLLRQAFLHQSGDHPMPAGGGGEDP